MGAKTKAAGRHVEEQRRYRARLRERSKVGRDGKAAPRGAPETRVVVQALAVAVRGLAGSIKSDPGAVSPEAKRVYAELLQAAFMHLVEQGFDHAESSRRLTLYTAARASSRLDRVLSAKGRRKPQSPSAPASATS